MTAAARVRRPPRPKLPLFTGQSISIDSLSTKQERARKERGKNGVQRMLLADLANPLLTTGPVVVVAIPNGAVLQGGWRGWKSLQRDGARKGAADLAIIHGGRTIWLEVKSVEGSTTDDQDHFISDCAAAGVVVRVGKGLPACRAILTELGVFREGVL